jgi:predicted alpha/beta hydrolase
MESAITALAWIGALVVAGYLIRTVASAIQSSGLKELTFTLRFRGNEKPPKQLNQ